MDDNYYSLYRILELGEALPESSDRAHEAVNDAEGCRNYFKGELVRSPAEGKAPEAFEGVDRWFAPEKRIPGKDLESFNGIWSEVCAVPDPKRLINPGVDNYIVINNGCFSRYTLEGELIQTQTLILDGEELLLIDEQNNKNTYQIEIAEHSGGFRLDCIGGLNKGQVISLRPWIDHMFTVKGEFADHRSFGTLFVGFLNGTATWRCEDEILGAVSSYKFTGDSLSFCFDHEGGGPQGVFSITGKVTKLPDGIIWKADGLTLRFTRNFDGVWRCPGYNSFCLTSMGNVKTFQNYEKKTRTPVIFVCDYERSLIIERYMDHRRLTYAACFYQTSQIMNGLDGIDLGRRFENLYYLDGIWKFVEDGQQCELMILGKECNLRKDGAERHGRAVYYEGLLTITVGSEKLNFIVDIKGLNAIALIPALSPDKVIELDRAESL